VWLALPCHQLSAWESSPSPWGCQLLIWGFQALNESLWTRWAQLLVELGLGYVPRAGQNMNKCLWSIIIILNGIINKYMSELSWNVFFSDSTKQCQTMQGRGGVWRVWGNMDMLCGVYKTRVWQGRAKTTVTWLVLHSWGALIWFRTYLNCSISILFRSMLRYTHIYIYIYISFSLSLRN